MNHGFEEIQDRAENEDGDENSHLQKARYCASFYLIVTKPYKAELYWAVCISQNIRAKVLVI